MVAAVTVNWRQEGSGSSADLWKKTQTGLITTIDNSVGIQCPLWSSIAS